jgi:hypothetical protein
MRTLLVILIIAAIVGFFTVPSLQKFNDYLAKKGKDTGKCTSIGNPSHHSYKVFSIDYVDYCGPVANSSGEQIQGMQKTRTDKYLGIFGMFIKL